MPRKKNRRKEIQAAKRKAQQTAKPKRVMIVGDNIAKGAPLALLTSLLIRGRTP